MEFILPTGQRYACQERGRHNLRGFSIVTSPYCSDNVSWNPELLSVEVEITAAEAAEAEPQRIATGQISAGDDALKY